MSLLIIDQVTKEYRNRTVLDSVNLRVEKGERVALIGHNGAGKTTLMKIALGLETADSGQVVIARNTKVGYLSQNIDDDHITDSFNTTAVYFRKVQKLEEKLGQIEQALSRQVQPGNGESKKLLEEYSKAMAQFEALGGYTAEARLKKILFNLGLRTESLELPVAKLSGGERMRAAVARIMLEEPDLLLLDEPTNHLDIRAIEWFEKFLLNFSGGVVFVSHDRYFLNRVATRIAELAGGVIRVRSGNYASFTEHKKQLAHSGESERFRLHWTIRNERSIVQSLKSHRKSKAVKSRELRIAKLKKELAAISPAGKGGMEEGGKPKISFKKIKHVSKRIVWAEDVSKSFAGVTLFSGASFLIQGGDRVGIIGPNGCGKTTLLRMLLGEDLDYTGTIQLGSWVDYAYIGQTVVFANEGLTPLQYLMDIYGLAEVEARDHLARLQFYGDDVNKKIKVLSGGERVRVYLAGSLLQNPDCFILDEPTNHLDMPAREAVEDALQDFNGTIIAVTHDRQFLTSCVNRILEIDDGKIAVYEGNYEHYRKLKEDQEEEKVPQTKVPAQTRRLRGSPSKKQTLTEKLQGIEDQLLKLETAAKQMEDSFSESTAVEEYYQYGQLLKEIEVLYEKWDMAVEGNEKEG